MSQQEKPAPFDIGLEHVLAAATPVAQTERLPLDKTLGRVIAGAVTAPISIPPFRGSAMDGYALRTKEVPADGTVLPIIARIAAGDPVPEMPDGAGAIRLFTGSIVPEGFDAVAMQEDCTLSADKSHVTVPLKRPEENIRPAGEDVQKGRDVLAAGHRLRPQDMAILSALGLTEIEVFKPLRIAVMSTGSELKDPGQPLAEAQRYESNRLMLKSLLSRMGFALTDLGILEDDRALISSTLAEAAKTHDVIMTTGGVSVGEEDHVRAAVEDRGSIDFWRLAMKPGKPVATGHLGAARFIGLPGNPVSVMVTALMIAGPMLRKLQGRAVTSPLRLPVKAGFSLTKKTRRREFVRVWLETDESGNPTAQLYGNQGSGVLSSLVAADGLADLAEGLEQVSPGDIIGYMPFDSLLA